MRIAFFVDQFPSLSETFILNQITGLIDRGHEVDIYCDRQGNIVQMHPEVATYHLLDRTYYTLIPINKIWRYVKGVFLFLFNFYKAPRLILKSLNIPQYPRTRYGELADLFKPLYLLLPLLSKPAYDVVHCHYGRNGLKAILLKDLGVIDSKIVTVFHGYDISLYLLMFGEDVYDYLFKRADLLQPISHLWLKRLIALGCSQDKVAVHRMGIDCRKFVPVTKQNSDQQQITIVSVARLVEKKGLSYAVAAVAQLVANHPQLQLQYHIIGDGVLREELEQQIEDLQVARQVKLLGWKDRSEVQAIIARADIVLAPSITSSIGDCEGIPVSLMETMAQAIPVVSTNHSGIPELVEDGVTGYLVPEKNITALAGKLEHLIDNPSLRQQMGRAGRDKVLKDYNMELLCDRLVQTYQQLISP